MLENEVEIITQSRTAGRDRYVEIDDVQEIDQLEEDRAAQPLVSKHCELLNCGIN